MKDVELHCSIFFLWNKIVPSSSSSCYVEIDGLVQERRNSSALAMELCLSCTKSLVGPWEISMKIPDK